MICEERRVWNEKAEWHLMKLGHLELCHHISLELWQRGMNPGEAARYLVRRYGRAS